MHDEVYCLYMTNIQFRVRKTQTYQTAEVRFFEHVDNKSAHEPLNQTCDSYTPWERCNKLIKKSWPFLSRSAIHRVFF